MNRARIFVLGLLGCLATTPAVAGEPQAGTSPEDESVLFQEVPQVYGASKFLQRASDAPASVSVLTGADIRAFGYRTLSDVLRALPGFYATYDRNYSFVGVRGFGRPGDYNTRVLLVVDGHTLNDNIYLQANVGTESLIDVDMIDRIEVIRGAGSSLYGSNAFFAVINVITRRGRAIDGVELTAGYGTQDTYLGRATLGQRFSNGAELAFSLAGYGSDGDDHLYFPEFDSPSTNNGIASGLDGDRARRFIATLSYEGLQLQVGYVKRTKDVPTASFGSVFNADGSNTMDSRRYGDLQYEISPRSDLTLLARAYWDQIDYGGDYNGVAAMGGINRDISRGEGWGTETRLTSRFWPNHIITLGLEYRDNYRLDQLNFDLDPPATYIDSKADESYAALYMQDEWRITKSFRINAGLRYDHYSDFGGSTNPRLAAILDLAPSTTAKLIYATAFRAPNAYERYYGDPVLINYTVNPNLEPEEITSYETVVEHQVGSNIRTSLSLYKNKIRDLISFDVDPDDPARFKFQNIESIATHGAELEVDAGFPHDIRVRSSYAYQESRDQATDAPLSNSPRHLTKLHVNLPLPSTSTAVGIEWLYTSSRKTLLGARLGSFALANLTLNWNSPWRGVTTALNVYNLFDKRFDDPSSGNMQQDALRQDGRLLLGQVRFHY